MKIILNSDWKVAMTLMAKSPSSITPDNVLDDHTLNGWTSCEMTNSVTLLCSVIIAAFSITLCLENNDGGIVNNKIVYHW